MKLPLVLALSVCLALLGGCGSGENQTSGSETQSTGATSTTSNKPSFSNIVLSDEKEGGTPKEVFDKDTPEIFVTFDLNNVSTGTEIKGTWICEESEAAPPNYKIDEKSMQTVAGMNVGNFSLSKPTKGWPVGKYRVDMTISGGESQSAKFEVK